MNGLERNPVNSTPETLCCQITTSIKIKPPIKPNIELLQNVEFVWVNWGKAPNTPDSSQSHDKSLLMSSLRCKFCLVIWGKNTPETLCYQNLISCHKTNLLSLKPPKHLHQTKYLFILMLPETLQYPNPLRWGFG